MSENKELPQGFTCDFTSPPEQEYLVAEILYENNVWALIIQEKENTILKLFALQNGLPWIFKFEDTITTLQIIKMELMTRIKR